MSRWAWGLLLTGLMGVNAVAADPPKIKALMLTQSAGFVHESVNRREYDLSPAEVAMTQLGRQSKLFTLHCTQNAQADFTKDNLKNYDVVMFYTTLNLPIADADRDYFFKEWLPAKGHAFVGFHSASDTFHDYQPYWDMIGGTFDGHPWNAGETVTITVHDTQHPAMRPFGGELVIKDEIYQYKNYQPEKVRVLMSLDMSKCPTKKPYMVPVSWVKNYGEGRVFYTNLGHNEATWTNPLFLEHVTNGLKWAVGQLDGDATPNPAVQKELEAKAKRDTEAAEKK
jgi:type 1 glutamine amidotransferase